MSFGATKFEPLRRRGPSAMRLVLLLGGLALASAPALAADTKLQEFLGKAQSDAEKKAVNDLVDKLKGVPPRPKAPEGAPQSPDQSGSTQSSTSPDAPGLARVPDAPTKPGAPAAPPAPPSERVATPAPVTPPPPAPPTVKTSPDAAVESAEQKRSPSVDLEVYFAYNSAEITGPAVGALRTLGEALRDASLANDSFLIVGHTDSKGGAAFNLALSQRRAEAVRQFLIANFDIDGAKLVAKGYGLQKLKNARQPLSAQNRRVQVVNLSKDAQRP
jgi:outer membrane protein OmpA-like peptidoglycan-associated protein